MRHVILYRRCNNPNDDDREIKALQSVGFTLLTNRAEIKPGDLVVPRYSALPFYNELAKDVELLGGKLINSVSEHNYVADFRSYVADLQELTPDSWDKLENLPDEGSFVLKGATNSKKFHWNTMMFAPDKKAAMDVYSLLCKDSLIGYQEIFIRRYVPLKTYMIGLSGLPITKEFRFFVYKGNLLCGSFYWSSHIEEIDPPPDINEVPESFLKEVMARIGDNVSFYVIDVAQTEEGKWIVIELNDGMMSGLSLNDPNLLYVNLKSCLEIGSSDPLDIMVAAETKYKEGLDKALDQEQEEAAAIIEAEKKADETLALMEEGVEREYEFDRKARGLARHE